MPPGTWMDGADSIPQTNNRLEIRPAIGIVLFTKRGEGLHPGARHQPVPAKGNSTIACCPDNFVPLVAVTQQKVSPSSRHDPATGKPCASTEVKETMLKLLEPLSETLIDDGAVKKQPLPEQEARRNPIAQTGPPSAAHHAGETLYATVNKKRQLGQRGPKPKGGHNVLSHLPQDPNCELCWMTQTTRAIRNASTDL